jgi:hypothetical protein
MQITFTSGDNTIRVSTRVKALRMDIEERTKTKDERTKMKG